MEIRMGCGNSSDDAFVEAFENCSLPNSSFRHADHVRLTWIYVRRFGEQGATEHLLEGIRQFAIHNGAAQKFNYTQTRAWVRIIGAAHRSSPDITNFPDLVAVHPHLLDTGALAKHYSKALLESASARAGWIEPDLSLLPG
jgi:hypothetical protein